MTVVISMLRGINVGGHHRVKMDALRALYASLKLRDVQTYVQSGNVIFRTAEYDLVRLSKKIESGIERSFGFHSAVILRTVSDLKGVLAKNPFAKRPGIDPRKLLVTFLAEDPGLEARAEVLSIKANPEEVRTDGREIYVYFPNGMGRSKFPWARIDKIVKTPGTGRNWNTVTKLVEMAEELEAAG